MIITRNIVYRDDPSGRCVGDLFEPATPVAGAPAVLLIHGGGWTSLSKERNEGFAEFLALSGYAVYNINYRLAPAAPWPACGDDCLDAARWWASGSAAGGRTERPRRIVVIGLSAGGHLALMTGLRLGTDAVAGIVVLSGIGDLDADRRAFPWRYSALFGNREPTAEQLAGASPLPLVSPQSPRILWTHAFLDPVVPFESCRNFMEAAAARGAEVELHAYTGKGSGHFFWREEQPIPRLHRELEVRILEFLARCGTAVKLPLQA